MFVYLLQHLLTKTARQYPDKEAVVFKGDTLTYSSLEEKSNQLAAALSQSGVKTGDRVGIMLNKSIEAIISIFGILKTGAIYVPIDAHTPTSRVLCILKNCDIKYLISSSTNVKAIMKDIGGDSPLRHIILVDDKVDTAPINVSNIEILSFEMTLRNQKGITFQSNIADVSPAYILHTSGSTGVPKGVVISHLNALTFINMAAEFFHIKSKDRLCSVAPLHFDLSVFDIFVAIRQGATLVLTPEYLTTFPAKLAEYISNQRITVWNSVASLLSILAEKGALEKYTFETMRIVHFSGDILPVKYLRHLKRHMNNAEFYNIYGQTEANSSMCYQVKDIPNDSWKVPIGKPFPNFEVFLLDENGRAQRTPGHEGELYVKAATVALGYWRNEKETNEKFITDPRNSDTVSRCYKTGDLVRIDAEGNFIFVGRKDHMIKSRGYRIELAEVESTLISHPLVRQAVVIPVPDELIGNRLIGHISLIDDGKLTENDISIFCGRVLPKYMVPETFIFHDTLPTISTGKIDRKLLEKQFIEGLKMD
ncbi:MAG: amino acid adenylation domain-containing protein [Smithella sp.]|jgi:amino acid adenylation domain-containing protein